MKQSNPRSGAQSPVEAISVLRSTLRKWGLPAFVFGGLLAAGTVALIIWWWEPVYDAKQFIRVDQGGEFSDVTASGQQKVDPRSVLAPIKSEFVLNQLLLNEEIRTKPGIDYKKLQKMIRFEGEGGGERYAIICRDRSPDYAAKVVEILTKEFIDQVRLDRKKKLGKLKGTLADAIKEEQDEIDRISTELRLLNERRLVPSAGDTEPMDPDGSLFKMVLNRLDEYRLEKQQYIAEIEDLTQDLASVEQDFVLEDVQSLVDNSGEIVAIDRALQDLNNLLAEKAEKGPNHPDIASLNRRIAILEKSRSETGSRLMTAIKDSRLAERKNQIKEEIDDVNQKLDRCQLSIDSSEKTSRDLAIKLRETNRLNFDFENMLMQKERAYQRRDDWLEKQVLIESKDMSLNQVSFLGDETVQAPTTPVERYPFKLLAIGGIAGFFLPFAAAFALELTRRKISSPEQFEQQMPVKLLGEIADLPIRTNLPARLSSNRYTKQLRLYEESIDNLSALLVFSSKDLSQVFSVTSAASNEGKTTLSSQLAISSSRANYGRTLLIDADLRSPSLHRMFDAPLEIGLCDALSETLSLDEVIKETSIDNLDLITAGNLRSNPRRYFAGENWTELLNEARQKYDQVIVDTPPVLAASESLAISLQCEYTLMCALRDVSRTDATKRAYERLVAADVNVIGCAFSGVPQNEYASRYGSYEYNM